MLNNKNILWFQYVVAYEHRVRERQGTMKKNHLKFTENSTTTRRFIKKKKN